MSWNAIIERRLLELGGTAAEQAAVLSSEFGVPFTEDQVRNKRKRLKTAIENGEIAVESGVDPRLRVSAAPGYIGPTIAFWDLETTFGSGNRILCGSICDGFGKVTAYDTRDYAAYAGDDCEVCPDGRCDRVVAVEIRDALEGYTIIAGWNSKLFDVPVLNARLVRHGERPLAAQMHVDLMYYATGTFMRAGRRSLENISKVFRSPNSKTPLSEVIWDKADHGDGEAYDLILEHNIADVRVTRDVYAHLQPFIRNIHRAG